MRRPEVRRTPRRFSDAHTTFMTRAPSSPPRSELFTAIFSLRRAFFAVAAFSLCINLLMLVPSLYMLQIYDRVITSRNGMTLLMITLIMLLAYALLGILEWVRSRLLIGASLQFDEALKDRVFNAAFEAVLRGRGVNPAQALADLTQLRQFLGGNGLIAFFDAPWVPVFLVVITLLHPMLGLLSLVGGIVLFVLTLLTERLTHQPLSEANALGIQAGNYAGNTLRNAEVIEAMGMQARLRERWRSQHDKSLDLQELASDRAGSIGAVTRFTRIALQSLALGAGAWLVIDDKLGPGSMIAASILMGRALSPIEQVIGGWRNLTAARSSYTRLAALFAALPPRTAGLPLPRPVGHLLVDNVSAAAPNRDVPILKGIRFALAPGEILAIIGPSASGKSSLARLLVGVWPAAAGKVRLDGADVHDWNKLELGRHVGYMPQDVELFEGTIAANIARFAEPDPEKIVRAAQRAGIHEMILRFPTGYDTEIGVGGAFLSGGQRQRIGLARAIYDDPVLIVLDEPNSQLDETGEAALAQALAELRARGSTIAIVTHRPNVLGIADKLLLLRDGAQQMFGPRAEVLAALAKAMMPKKPELER